MTNPDPVQTKAAASAVKFSSIMLGTSNPQALADSYAKIFNRAADMVEEGGWYMWGTNDGSLSIGEHSEVKGQAKEPARVIINLETADVKGEFERIKAAGVTVIKEPYEMGGGWIATLADADGNYVQLMTPWEEG